MNPISARHSTLFAVPILATFLAQTPGQDAPLVPRPIAPQAEKPMPRPDPVKGYDRVDAATAAIADRTRAPRAAHADGPVAQQLLTRRPASGGQVLFADADDGRTWASGDTYKASFGRDGFTYVPFLGSDAPRNYPMQFALQSVAVAGKPIAFDRQALPTRQGQRVVFDRGVIQEIYDLSPDGVEQTFVVDATAAGDVTVAMQVHGELREDGDRAGLQFVNERGGVHYGDAFVVAGEGKRAIASSFADGQLHLHVAATQRPAGALVIDPIISTHYVGSTAQDCAESDVAFDASNARYMLVWQRQFSQTDIDIWAEMRDTSGLLVPNSAQAIDNSSAYWRFPRVANLNAYDRFLVVAEVYVAGNPTGQQFTVWGRTVDAAGPFPRSGQFQISSTHSGEKRRPDVGGDAGLTTPSYWTVAYTRDFSATDRDIHARQVEATGTVRPGTILVEDTAGTIYDGVAISPSNGHMSADRRRWALAYTRYFNATDSDVYAATLSWDGQITQPSTAIDNSISAAFLPRISSALDLGSRLQFAITYAINGVAANIAAAIVDGQLATEVPNVNVASLVGMQGLSEVCVETDGCRFVVGFTRLADAYLTTLAVLGSNLVVHEPPQLVDASHAADTLQLASQASGGRVASATPPPTSHFGLVYIDTNTAVDRVVFTTYEGHGRGGYTARAYACGGVGIAAAGRPWLGGEAHVSLSGIGSEVPGMLIGLPGPALMICAGCRVGVDLAGPVIHVPNAASLTLPIPRVTHLAGATITVQGYAAGTGACLGVLRFSDALDIKVQ